MTALAGQLLPAGAPLPTAAAAGGTGAELERLLRAWLIEYPSAHTIDAYRRDLDMWLDFCAASGLDPLGAKLTATHIAAWLKARAAAGEKTATRARRLAAVSAFYSWLAARGHRPLPNPVAALEPKKKPAMTATTPTGSLTREQAAALLAVADRHRGPSGPRAAAVVALLLYCGLRVGELVGATVTQLGHDRGHRVLWLVGKGGKPRPVPIPPPVARRVDAYLAVRTDLDRLPAHRDQAGAEHRPLLATASGRPLDRGAVWRLLRCLARRAGIPVTMSPHVLRATCATLGRDAGAGLDELQELLGHADVRTTRAYDKAAQRLDRSPVYQLARYLHEDTPAAHPPPADTAAVA